MERWDEGGVTEGWRQRGWREREGEPKEIRVSQGESIRKEFFFFLSIPSNISNITEKLDFIKMTKHVNIRH